MSNTGSIQNQDKLLGKLQIDRSAEPEPRNNKTILLGLIIIAPISLIAWWYFNQSSPIPVKTQMARISSITTQNTGVLNATGYVTARRQATVSSKVTGKITEVLVEEGLHVKEGDILARLDDSNLYKEYKLIEAQKQAATARVEEASARLQEAHLTLNRTKELATQQLISQAKLDADTAAYQSLLAQLATREAELTSAQSNVQLYQQRLEDLVIRAPFTGVVVTKNAQPGEMISPVSAGGGFTRTGICSLVDMNSLEVEVDVNEAYIDRVFAGQQVEAKLDAYPDWRISSKVITIIPTADRQKATVKVRIGFNQLDEKILPDMGVKVVFLDKQVQNTGSSTGDNHAVKGQLLLPESAIQTQNGNSFVFIIDNQIAKQKRVQGKYLADGSFQVQEGIKPGQTFIIEIPEQLTDQATVIVQ